LSEAVEVFDWSLTDEEMETIRGLNKEHRFFNPPFEEQKKHYLQVKFND